MEKVLYFEELTQKNLYFFLTKFLNLAAFILSLFIIYIGDLNSGIVVLSGMGMLYLFLQVGYSRLFPHNVAIYNDKVEFIGPWKIGRQTIKFSNIKSIVYDDESIAIKPKWPGLNAVYILKSLDPDKNIKHELMSSLKEHSHINYIKKDF